MKKFEIKSFSQLIYNIMKSIETLKELHPKINAILGELDAIVKDDTKKIKKEYAKLVMEARISLLKEICDGEELDFSEIKNKYLSEKERKNISETNTINAKEIVNEILLDTIVINSKTYFYENKEKGVIFDSKSKPVGVIKNGQPVLN
jgi:hypothetical protein